MYFNLDWEIYFKNEVENKVYRLGLLLECEIEKNVENLADIATITLAIVTGKQIGRASCRERVCQ